MVKCEGYKAFHGSAVIKPVNPKFPPFEEKGDWLYKPEFGCWYCNGHSYPSEIVTEIKEAMNGADLIEEIENRIEALKDLVVSEANVQELRGIVSNLEKWVNSVKARV